METENPDTKPERETTKTEQQGGESQQGPAALLPVEEPPHSEAKVQDADKGRDETDSEEGKAFNKLADAEAEQTKWERMQGEWTRIGAVTTAALGLATFLLLFHQTCTLSKQLDAMQSSSNDTQKMIVAMQQQANASQNTADRQKDIVEQMGRQANASIDAANAATKQAAVSQSQANASVAQAEAAKQSASAAVQTARIGATTFAIGERPYIAVKEMGVINLTAGQTPTTLTTFENAGRTPALNARFQTCIQSRADPLPNPPVCESPEGLPANPVFVPAGGVWRMFVPFGGNTIETDIENIKTGKTVLYVWGDVKYRDGAGNSHMLKYCALYNPKTALFNSCPYYNESN